MALPRQNDLNAAIAVTRFGLGARPGEIEAARTDPRGYLKAQIRAEGADQPQGPLSSSPDNFVVFDSLRRERQQLKGDGDTGDDLLKQVQSQIRQIAIEEMAARGRLAAGTAAGRCKNTTLSTSASPLPPGFRMICAS